MPDYIDLQIDTDPQDVLADAYTFLQSVIPGWLPSPGQLDVWLLMSLSSAAAETRDVASAVPKSIFRWFGANLINLPPIDDTPATSTIKVTMIDNAGYTLPDGTQVSIDVTGDLPAVFTTQGDVVVPPGSTQALSVTIVAVQPGSRSSGIGTVDGVVHLEDPLSFVSSITLNAVTTGGVDAETDDAYLNRLAAQLALLAPRPILPSDFAIFYRNIPGVYRAVAIDGYSPFHNLLTADESSFEASVANWAATNAALAQSATQAADGTNSMRMTASSAADMQAVLPAAQGKAVSPGDAITVVASFRADTTGRNVKVGIRWYDAGGSLVSDSFGSTVADVNTGFTQAAVTATAPATAVKAAPIVFVTSPANTEIHYVDKVSLRRGSTTDWVLGGTGETTQPRTISVAGIDLSGNPVSAPVKAEGVADLQARREVNFLVYAIDPVVSAVDVTYTVKVLPGADPATVVANVNAALAGYLNAATWGLPQGSAGRDWVNAPVVRYLEVAAIINSAEGVDYITTTGGNYDLTIRRAGGTLARLDVTLPGAAPLAGAGTFTGTAV